MSDADRQPDAATTDDAEQGIGQRAQEAGVVDQQAVVKDQIDEGSSTDQP